MEQEILDDFKKKEPLKNSRICLALLAVSGAAIAIFIIVLIIGGLDSKMFEPAAWLCGGACILANIVGLIYGGLSLYKNEEDMAFQLIGIGGHITLAMFCFGVVLAMLTEPSGY